LLMSDPQSYDFLIWIRVILEKLLLDIGGELYSYSVS
jgi:hypothetical protein